MEYIIKFFDKEALMREVHVFANSPSKALSIALLQTEGLVSFDNIKLIYRGTK